MVAVGASGRCIETREVSKPPVVQRTAQKLDPAQRRVKKDSAQNVSSAKVLRRHAQGSGRLPEMSMKGHNSFSSGIPFSGPGKPMP